MSENQSKPRGNPNWKPGVSGNPGGRPRGFARAVRETVGDDPRELASIAWSIANGQLTLAVVKAVRNGQSTEMVEVDVKPTVAERLHALEFLRDSGWGKPTQAVELSGPDGAPLSIAPAIDLDRLSPAQFAALQAAREALLATNEPRTIDAVRLPSVASVGLPSQTSAEWKQGVAEENPVAVTTGCPDPAPERGE